MARRRQRRQSPALLLPALSHRHGYVVEAGTMPRFSSVSRRLDGDIAPCQTRGVVDPPPDDGGARVCDLQALLLRIAIEADAQPARATAPSDARPLCAHPDSSVLRRCSSPLTAACDMTPCGRCPSAYSLCDSSLRCHLLPGARRRLTLHSGGALDRAANSLCASRGG
jgi:hypothetical protein